MDRAKAITYWEGLHKTFSSQLEKEENHFGRMHLQYTLDVLDTTIAALREPKRERGEWVSVGLSALNCNQCGYTDNWKEYHHFCPNCGADMRPEGGADHA